MKTILFSILVLLGFASNAQLVPCRPKICMIVYEYHNDNNPNAQKTAIQGFLPEILIDNTPHGYYGEQNGYVGCNPADYVPLGTEVYCYLIGGYEGTSHQNNMDDSALNIARIQGIAGDGATGVFLDEVSNFPNASHKAYIQAMYDKCQSLGLKLILNPGTSLFDPWLIQHCDYILTREHYNGTDAPSPSEQPYLNKVLVVCQSVTTASAAAAISLGARANGFHASYACDLYINIPGYLAAYNTQMTQAPAAPIISQVGSTLHSNYPVGNQWYETVAGPILNDTNQNFTPLVTGTYYSIVSIDTCHSDTSNKITVIGTSVPSISSSANILLYPNPATEFIAFEVDNLKGKNVEAIITNAIGETILLQSNTTGSGRINIQSLATGIYMLVLRSEQSIYRQSFVKQY